MSAGGNIDLQAWRKAVFADQRVGRNARRVAEVLADNFADGACQVSLERIADAALIISGAGPVREAVARLEARGWIVIEKPSDANRRGLRYRPAMCPARTPASLASSP